MVVFFSQNICHMIECLHKCKHFTRWKIWKHSIFFSVSHETDAWFMNFLFNLLFSKNLKKSIFIRLILKIKIWRSNLLLFQNNIVLSIFMQEFWCCLPHLPHVLPVCALWTLAFIFLWFSSLLWCFLRLCFLDTARADAAATGSLCKVFNVKLRKARLANLKSWF